ncbi:PHP domain-containing protein [Staphylospora marina]|uniref:PHP domain-containing protein n=1 Tax=Staphylospora marina TaxID=2490858 RepID=UPI000F5BEF24|nr:PHP domain-containing protein [Staphylospora marina]
MGNRQRKNMKTDGHTHTHYCPHGSGEETAKYIERAIELGFEIYVLTEHPPEQWCNGRVAIMKEGDTI